MCPYRGNKQVWRRVGAECVTLAGSTVADVERMACERKIPHCSTSLEVCLQRPGVDAVVLTGPGAVGLCEQSLRMGKHALLEVCVEDLGLLTEDARDRLAAFAAERSLVCLVTNEPSLAEAAKAEAEGASGSPADELRPDSPVSLYSSQLTSKALHRNTLRTRGHGNPEILADIGPS